MKVSKVKGHATQAMVDNGEARHEDLVGNDGADTAADLGRLRTAGTVSLLLDALLSGSDVSGILSCWNSTSLWIQNLVLRSIMMVLVALLRMPWFGTKVVSSKLVPPPFRLIVLPLFLVLLVS